MGLSSGPVRPHLLLLLLVLCVAVFGLDCALGHVLVSVVGCVLKSIWSLHWTASVFLWLCNGWRCAVARMCPGLQALGEYLGSPTASESGVLAAFAQQFPMEGVSLYGALQTFVGAFRLPGEAQCIDRIIEAFAAAYWAQNPAFPCVGGRDTLYVLAFSLVMLSTDLHNPNVAEKMTPGQFLRNNAGIDDGADLPAPTLHALYTDVQRGPLRLKGSCKPVLVQLVQVIASNTLPDTIVGLHCEAVAALAQQPVPSVEDDNGA